MMFSILLFAFFIISVASSHTIPTTFTTQQILTPANLKWQKEATGPRLIAVTSKTVSSRSTMEALLNGRHLAGKSNSVMSNYNPHFSSFSHPALATNEYHPFSHQQIPNSDRQMGDTGLTMSMSSLTMTMSSLNMTPTAVQMNSLNFESCVSDANCLGARTCIEIGETEVVSCAGGDCFCLTADPVCFSSFECSAGEFCEDSTGFCVASSVVIGTELNGESCLDTSNCTPVRTCVQINDDGSSALCSGLGCFCTTADPTCTSDLDCAVGETCLSIDGFMICLANAVLPVAPLSLSAQPCQQDSDCFDPTSRVCAQVQSVIPFEACDGGRCACVPLTGCQDSIECFLGETCEMDASGGICIQDGSLLPPPTPTGFNFEPCVVNDDCQVFRTCVEFVPFGDGVTAVPCQGNSCFCLTDSPGCSGPDSLECSFGESCFTTNGVDFLCTSDAIIPFLEPS